MTELHPLYCLPEYVHPYLRVCFAIARDAHAFKDQKRNKANEGKLDYNTHLAAAVNILLISGEKDPAVLSAAILHDVLEDCEAYLEEKMQERQMQASPPYADVLIALLDEAFEQEAKDGVLFKPAEKWLGDIRRVVSLVEELTSPKGLGKAKRIKRALGAMNYSEDAAKIKIAELAGSLADDIITPPKKVGEEQLEYNDYVWAVAKSAAHVSDSRPEKLRNRQITDLFKLVNHLHHEHRLMNDYPEQSLSDEEKQQKREDFNITTAWAKALGMPDWKRAKPAEVYVEHGEAGTKGSGLTHIGLTDAGMVTRARIVFDFDAEKFDEHYAIINKLTRLIEHHDPSNAVTYGRSDDFVPEQEHHQIKLKLLKPMPLNVFIDYAQQAGAVDRDADRCFLEGVFIASKALSNGEDLSTFSNRWASRVNTTDKGQSASIGFRPL